ncbi:MAG: 2,3,4,5-tetrahydropyridine-2,6-dicarboxylate N-succinyltransferase [Pseudomonadota bacterium]
MNELFELPSDQLEPHGAVIEETIQLLNRGELKVCEQKDGEWIVNQWAKKAILLYFRYRKMEKVDCAPFSYFDKIPLKQWTGDEKVRVVPQALARYGCFIDEGAILMPSYVNIGAYVGKGTLVDTWATVGSCAHIGAGVHLSGGVGIGGVLEPLQANPVIVEDGCFIGSRCILVEGVIVKKGAVLGAGVTITGSTRILDVSGSEPKEYRGTVPENSVVIPGTRTKTFPAGDFQVPCALIIGKRKTSTDEKTSLNDALREFDVTV